MPSLRSFSLAFAFVASLGCATLPQKPAPKICTGLLPEAGTNALLVSVTGFGGHAPDEFRLTLPSKDLAKTATHRDRGAGWTMKRKSKQLIFTGRVPTDGRVELRVDLARGSNLGSLEVQGFAGGKKLFGPVAAQPRTLPRGDMVLLRPPAQVVAGEPIELRSLGSDSCWTPPGGTWTVSGVAAAPDPEDSGLLHVALPADLDPREPIGVTFTLPSGETSIANSFDLDQVRVVPSLREDGPPRMGACRTARYSVENWLCVCGWFPGVFSHDGVLVDGRPRQPDASSSRALCYRIDDAGEHRVTPAKTSPLDKTAEVVQQKISVALEGKGVEKVRVGKTTKVTWTVTGTRDPVELRVWIPTPGFVRMKGGPSQRLRTSGGSKNEVTVKITGLNPGRVPLRARIEGSGQSSDSAYRALLGRFALQVLRDAEARFRREVEARRREESDPEGWLRELVLETRDALLTQLRYLELAPLYDYTSDVFQEVEAELKTRSAHRVAPSFPRSRGRETSMVRLASMPAGNGDTETSEMVIDRILEFFSGLLASDVEITRDIQIRSSPEGRGVYFSLYARSYPSERFGDDYTTLHLDNLFLGKYTWEASPNIDAKEAKISSGEINLLRSEKSTLCCTRRNTRITCKWVPEEENDCPRR